MSNDPIPGKPVQHTGTLLRQGQTSLRDFLVKSSGDLERDVLRAESTTLPKGAQAGGPAEGLVPTLRGWLKMGTPQPNMVDVLLVSLCHQQEGRKIQGYSDLKSASGSLPNRQVCFMSPTKHSFAEGRLENAGHAPWSLTGARQVPVLGVPSSCLCVPSPETNGHVGAGTPKMVRVSFGFPQPTQPKNTNTCQCSAGNGKWNDPKKRHPGGFLSVGIPEFIPTSLSHHQEYPLLQIPTFSRVFFGKPIGFSG